MYTHSNINIHTHAHAHSQTHAHTHTHIYTYMATTTFKNSTNHPATRIDPQETDFINHLDKMKYQLGSIFDLGSYTSQNTKECEKRKEDKP